MVPAPEQAPKRMTGFIFKTYRPNKIATKCGRIAAKRPTKTRLMPDFCNPEIKLGPAVKPTTPMNTAKPTVSKTHIAASGIRPNAGNTERSQPNTRPRSEEHTSELQSQSVIPYA